MKQDININMHLINIHMIINNKYVYNSHDQEAN